MIGPGKYDDLCTLVRTSAHAAGAIVIVLGGVNGNGFSCQAAPVVTAILPDVLESIAAQIRHDADASVPSQLARYEELRAQGWTPVMTAEEGRARYGDYDAAAKVPREVLYMDIGALLGRLEVLEGRPQ